MSDFILGGEVKAQCSSRSEAGLVDAIKQCVADQQEITGQKLIVVSTVQSHYVVTEQDGSVPQDVYEAFLTLRPVIDAPAAGA